MCVCINMQSIISCLPNKANTDVMSCTFELVYRVDKLTFVLIS